MDYLSNNSACIYFGAMLVLMLPLIGVHPAKLRHMDRLIRQVRAL